MALCTDDAETARGDDLFFLFEDFALIFVVEFLILFACAKHFFVVGVIVRRCRRNLLFAHTDFAHASDRKVFRVAAEHNIGTAPRHIRRDRNGANLTCLSDDFRFFFVVLGVKNVVRYLGFYKHR